VEIGSKFDDAHLSEKFLPKQSFIKLVPDAFAPRLLQHHLGLRLDTFDDVDDDDGAVAKPNGGGNLAEIRKKKN
jgi:hypothetical protein